MSPAYFRPSQMPMTFFQVGEERKRGGRASTKKRSSTYSDWCDPKKAPEHVGNLSLFSWLRVLHSPSVAREKQRYRPAKERQVPERFILDPQAFYSNCSPLARPNAALSGVATQKPITISLTKSRFE